MLNKIIVSNVRFPADEWIMLKTAAGLHEMSTNEYIKYLFQVESIKSITGTRKMKLKDRGYEAMGKFINRQRWGHPMGANEDDKIIYGIE